MKEPSDWHHPYDGKDATEITGPLSLDVIDSCIENIEEGDIE